MGITFKEAVDNQLLSVYTMNMLPLKCACGRELQFSDDMSKLICTEVNCRNSVIVRIENFAEAMGLEISRDEIVALLKRVPRVISPYQLIDLDRAYKEKKISKSVIFNLDKILARLKEIRQGAYYIYELAGMCGIESIQLIANKLFYGFNTVEEFYSNLYGYGADFLNDKLGISDEMEALSLADELKGIQEELQYAESRFNVHEHKRVFKVAFADNELLPYINKQEFIGVLNSAFSSSFITVSNIDSNTDILIRNDGKKSAKYMEAVRVNEKLTADKVNSGELEYKDIGLDKDVYTESGGRDNDRDRFKPLGQSIYIGSVEDVLNRLSKFRL